LVFGAGNSSAKVGTFEVRTCQVYTRKIGPAELRALKVGADVQGPLEMRPDQEGVFETCSPEISAVEARPYRRAPSRRVLTRKALSR
jgi:hypothetical protein